MLRHSGGKQLFNSWERDNMDLAKAAVKWLGTALLAAGLVGAATAGPIVYNFDTFDDATSLTTQYAGLSFTQSTVIKAGQSLNEASFPPHSADGVVFDDGGPITIVFSTPVFSVGGYFTYTSGLTFAVYDAGNALIGELFSAYANNIAEGVGDAGSVPNELIQFASAGGLIARITITADAGGSSLVLDDLTVDDGATSIPEPSSIALMAGVIAAGLRRRGWLRRS
jgi:predicted heme/steroid binding protein